MGLEVGFWVAVWRPPAWSSTAGFSCAQTSGDNARTATSCIKNRLWNWLFIFPPRLSERDTPDNLKGISLDCGRVREFLEYLAPHPHLPGSHADISPPPN